MMLKRTMGFLLFLWLYPVPDLEARTPSGEALLEKMDANTAPKTQTARLIVYGARGNRTYTFKTYVNGRDAAFVAFLSPDREKGVKMLKKDDSLFVWMPSTQRVITLSERMLDLSFMGSDLSYDDMMTDIKLQEIYRAEIIGEEIYGERSCWIARFTARESEQVYHTRKVWVDKERFVPLKEERFNLDGQLTKTVDIKEVMLLGERWMPRHVVVKDVFKSGDGTELFLEWVELDPAISPEMLTLDYLKKGDYLGADRED